MVVEFKRGKKQKFIAEKQFSLNWDDRDIKSVKIIEGQEVFYDGVVAFVDSGVGEVSGRCMGLKSAINVMGWLKPFKGNKKSEIVEKSEDVIFPEKDYDPKRGGSFDTFMKRTNNASPVRKREIIKEEDLIVKTIPSLKNDSDKNKSNKLEVMGDQVLVKKVEDRLIVSSSTIVPRRSKKSFKVEAADEGNAALVLPLKGVKKASLKEEKKTFIVDDKTPRNLREDMTKEEIDRLTKVVKVDDSQSATEVKKIAEPEKVKEVEGIDLKKISSPKDVQFNKTRSLDGLTIKTTVSSGSNVANQGAVIVGTSKLAKKKGANLNEEVPELTEEEKKERAVKLKEAAKKAVDRASARKKASIKTQELMKKTAIKESSEKIPEKVEEELPGKGLLDEVVENLEKESVKKVLEGSSIKASDIVSGPKEELKIESLIKVSDKKKSSKLKKEEKISTDFLLMLPDNWGKLHWVKKEKFIKILTDTEFINFILSMESVKAVKNACLERLKELE